MNEEILRTLLRKGVESGASDVHLKVGQPPAYRVRGLLLADTDPLEYLQRSHPDLEIEKHGLTLWDLDREFATGRFGGEGRPFMKLRNILGILRDSYCRTVGIEYMHLQEPAERAWFQDKLEVPFEQPATTRAPTAATGPAFLSGIGSDLMEGSTLPARKSSTKVPTSLALTLLSWS